MTSPGGGLDRAARAWLVCGLAGLVATVLAGLWVGALLAFGYLLPAADWAQFGRMRPVHTRLAVNLWLLPSVLGVLRARLPVSPATATDRAMPWIWAAVQVCACVAVVVSGVAGPPYAESPAVFDLAGVVLLVLAALPILRTLRAGGRGHEGTGLLYAAEMLVWAVLLTVLLHAVRPFVAGTGEAALHRLWLADSIGLVVTPAAAAAAYISLPALTGGPSRRPVLGRIGFYCLAATYVLAGGRHALFGPQSATVETLGWTTSLAIGVPSLALSWNVIESVWRGRSRSVADREGASWLFLGAALWMLLTLQGMLQSVPAVNAVVSKSDWVAGHAHLAFFGAVGALVTGAVQGVLASTPRPPRWTSLALRLGWAVAVLGMVWALSTRGLREAAADLEGIPSSTRFATIQGMWHMRLTFGIVAAAPLLAWAALAMRSLLLAPAPRPPAETRAGGGVSLVRRAAWAVGLGVGSLILVLALTPRGRAVDAAPPRGERIFLREGCIACHTLAPRDLPTDRALYGDPVDPRDGPRAPGTRRIGPDLAHVGSRRSPGWIAAHVARPVRSVPEVGHSAVAKTAMPSFAHLPQDELDALVEWLSSRR